MLSMCREVSAWTEFDFRSGVKSEAVLTCRAILEFWNLGAMVLCWVERVFIKLEMNPEGSSHFANYGRIYKFVDF